jgi:hypothetical protein
MFADKLVEKTVKEFNDFRDVRENKSPLKERIARRGDSYCNCPL